MVLTMWDDLSFGVVSGGRVTSPHARDFHKKLTVAAGR